VTPTKGKYIPRKLPYGNVDHPGSLVQWAIMSDPLAREGTIESIIYCTGHQSHHGLKVETLFLPNGLSTLFGSVSCRRGSGNYVYVLADNFSGKEIIGIMYLPRVRPYKYYYLGRYDMNR
jgi:hypothetical protein